MTGAALALGIIGAITGALALGWNIAAYLLAAGRAKVELRGAWLNRSTYATVRLDKFATSRPPGDLRTPALVVEVTNVGRMPITVTQCDVEVGSIGYGELRQPRNPTLPHRLDVGDQARWFFEVVDVLQAVDLAQLRGRKDVAIRGRATTGAGKARVSAQRTDPATLAAVRETAERRTTG